MIRPYLNAEDLCAKIQRIGDAAKLIQAELQDGGELGVGREFAVALTHLDTAVLWAAHGIQVAAARVGKEGAV